MWFDVCTVAVLINCGSYVIYPRIVYVCIRTLASLQVQSPNAAIGSRVIFLLVEAFSTKTFFFFLSWSVSFSLSSIPAFVRFVSSHCRHRPDPLLYLQHGYRLIHYGGDRLFMRPLDSLKVRWCQSLILTMPATRGCEPFLCASWRRSQLVFLCCPFTCSPARPCWVYVTELQSQIKTVTRLTHALMSVQDSHALVWMREGQDGMGVVWPGSDRPRRLQYSWQSDSIKGANGKATW